MRERRADTAEHPAAPRPYEAVPPKLVARPSRPLCGDLVGKLGVCLECASAATDGLHWRGDLLKGVPAELVDGVRRGVYSVSVGARVLRMDRRYPRSATAWNPARLEERIVRGAELFELSITDRPAYGGTEVLLRSQLADSLLDHGHLIYRAAPLRVEPVRDYLAEPVDYLADPVVDYLL